MVSAFLDDICTIFFKSYFIHGENRCANMESVWFCRWKHSFSHLGWSMKNCQIGSTIQVKGLRPFVLHWFLFFLFKVCWHLRMGQESGHHHLLPYLRGTSMNPSHFGTEGYQSELTHHCDLSETIYSFGCPIFSDPLSKYVHWFPSPLTDDFMRARCLNWGVRWSSAKWKSPSCRTLGEWFPTLRDLFQPTHGVFV